MNYPNLSHAPIVEAIIDFRFLPSASFDFPKLGSMHARISETYTVKHENKETQIRFAVGPDNTTQQDVTGKIIGYRFEAPKEKYVLQATLNGFTLSKLAPYQDWEQFLAEAKKLLEVFIDVSGQQSVARTAVRYINRIELHGTTVDFDEYLTAGPKIPSGLPQGLIEFVTRNVIYYPDQNATMVLIQALDVANVTKEEFPVILDIDVSCSDSYDLKSERQWGILSDLHDLKNKAFFESITEKTLGLLK